MNTNGAPEKYRRCLVLAGGGFRLGYYLGVHAAAEDCGCKPDVLLATCGGALAAAVIAGLPDAASRRAWMSGPAMYHYLHGIASTPNALPVSALLGVAQRWMGRMPARRIPDLWRDYLFDLPGRIPLPDVQDGTAVVTVGCRLLFAPQDAGQLRVARRLFAQVAFGPPRATGLLRGLNAPSSDTRWSSGAIAPLLETDSVMPLPDAVRTSIADMFYFRSHAFGSHHYSGGVIDLLPIELARQLANCVFMERKAPFDRWLALPALRAVFGIDGAARLAHVHAQCADAWIDTSSVRPRGIAKRVDWRGNRIQLALPPTQADFAAQVDAQWRYGYRCGIAAIASSVTSAAR